MRGHVSDCVCCTQGNFALRGEFLSARAERNQRAAKGWAQDGRSAPIFAHPLDPRCGGYPLNIAQPFRRVKSERHLNSHRATSSSRISYPSLRPDRAKLAHSIAPPLQRKPATLGFALGAAFGGLLDGKFRMVRFKNCAWLCRANATGPFPP